MIYAIIAVATGLVLLVWSADRFVEGAAALAGHLGVPSLLIGMVIVGFGTSAPEMVVSLFAALQGNGGIALGNAYGSNIANIGIILGLTAMTSPIAVRSTILKRELPILMAVTLLAAFQLMDTDLSIKDGLMLMAVFAVFMAWSVWQGLKQKSDALGEETEHELQEHRMTKPRAALWLGAGLLIMIASSRLLVWGAVEIAQGFGVSDLVIGLTIVAIGTSLPELASSLAAVRKNEHDIAIGNVIGSNMFNTLAVVGIASLIDPGPVDPEILSRDVLAMASMTGLLFIMGYGFRGPGRINRIEGSLLVILYLAYGGFLAMSVVGK